MSATGAGASDPGLVGALLSHYRVVERIGAGGMGDVYLARDERLGREVALKVLPAGALADDGARRRFHREALAASRVTHPNVGVVYDFAREGPVDFLVMEFVPGESLDRTIAAGALAEDDAVAIGGEIADALAALHELGVIHCDLKPGNVMRTPRGHVKLLDFGLSRLLRDDGPGGAVPSGTGSWSGTLPYMAPEQFTGARLDARTDLYALGVLLYELGTGRRPFEATDAAALMYAIVHTEAPAPRTRRPALSASFDRLVVRAMAKAPEQRFHSAAELRGALGSLAAPAPVVRADAPLFTSIAVLPLANLSADREQEFFADGMTETLIGGLAGIRALRVISRTSAMRYKGTAKSLPEIGRELNVDTVVEGSVLRSGDRVRVSVQLVDARADRSLWAGSYERSLDDVLTLQREVAEAIAAEIRVQISPVERSRMAGPEAIPPPAFDAYLRGRFLWNRRTVPDVGRALEEFRQAVALAPRFARAHAGVADAVNILGDLEAIPRPEAREQATAAARRALEIDPDLPEALASLGFVRTYCDWDWRGAEEAFAHAVRSGPGYATGHQWYAELLAQLGRFDEAEATARRALTLDPLALIMGTTLADVYFFSRHYDASIAELRRTLDLERDFVFALTDLGRVLTQARAFDEARAMFERAVAIAGDPGKALGGLAYLDALSGRTADARRGLEALEERVRRAPAAASYFALVAVHAALGEHDRAFEWLERSIATRDRALVWLKVHPRLDPLRDDPRFQSLLERVGLT